MVPDIDLDESPPPPLYIGSWLKLYGLKAAHVAKEAKLGKSYLSHLISRKKDNPSAAHLHRISRAVGIPMDWFYRPAPSLREFQVAGGLIGRAEARMPPGLRVTEPN